MAYHELFQLGTYDSRAGATEPQGFDRRVCINSTLAGKRPNSLGLFGVAGRTNAAIKALSEANFMDVFSSERIAGLTDTATTLASTLPQGAQAQALENVAAALETAGVNVAMHENVDREVFLPGILRSLSEDPKKRQKETADIVAFLDLYGRLGIPQNDDVRNIKAQLGRPQRVENADASFMLGEYLMHASECKAETASNRSHIDGMYATYKELVDLDPFAGDEIQINGQVIHPDMVTFLQSPLRVFEGERKKEALQSEVDIKRWSFRTAVQRFREEQTIEAELTAQAEQFSAIENEWNDLLASRPGDYARRDTFVLTTGVDEYNFLGVLDRQLMKSSLRYNIASVAATAVFMAALDKNFDPQSPAFGEVMKAIGVSENIIALVNGEVARLREKTQK